MLRSKQVSSPKKDSCMAHGSKLVDSIEVFIEEEWALIRNDQGGRVEFTSSQQEYVSAVAAEYQAKGIAAVCVKRLVKRPYVTGQRLI